MISISDYVKMLSIQNNLIRAQTAELTHADTLLQPPNGGNCMNWVLGHTLESQVGLLLELGGESPVPATALAIYARESQPLAGDIPGVLPLETLLEGHAQVHAALASRLSQMSEADFERSVQLGERIMTLGWRVFFLNFHLTYHIGQLELLRHLAGKTDKII